MVINKNDFFRRGVLIICGNVEIEKALFDSLIFLRRYMPVDKMFLQTFDAGYGAMRTIAEATPEGSQKVDLMTRLSDKVLSAIKKADFSTLPPAVILKHPQISPIGREMLAFHHQKAASIIVLSLVSEDYPAGSLILISEQEQFNEEHLSLIELLKEPFNISLSNAIKHREVLRLKDLLADDNRFLHKELRRLSGDTIIGEHSGLKKVMGLVRQVAVLDSPVLLLGETGVGKDVIANAIHEGSTRSSGPFISVNCGAIPETLIDSELFGYEKGAFTNAVKRKRGRFERAHKGTIFLDEIGELPLQAQVRLLRVLQNNEIERLGGSETVSLDFRVIAATNKNLEQMVENHTFRRDLWFRLHVFPIKIPPLRERKGDIPALVQYFITQKAKELKLPSFPVPEPGALDPLLEYNWPGNVRELENIVERALILSYDDKLRFDPLLFDKKPQPESNPEKPEPILPLNEIISRHIKKALEHTKGKIHGPGGAAKLLGLNANTLRNRMDKLGIEYRKG